MAEPYRDILLVSAVGVLGALGIYYATQPKSAPQPFQPTSFPVPPTGQGTYVPIDPSNATVTVRTGEQLLVAASSDDPAFATPEALALGVTDLFRQQTTLPVVMFVTPGMPATIPGIPGTIILSAVLNAFPGMPASTVTYARQLRSVQPRIAAVILSKRVG